MFPGAVGGVALSHLPGLPLVDGGAMGIGAMTVVMLRLPLTPARRLRPCPARPSLTSSFLSACAVRGSCSFTTIRYG